MLLNAQELSDALIDNSSADLAVIVSQQVFEDVILHNSHDLQAAEFAPVQIANANETRVTAWIRVADRDTADPKETYAYPKG